MKKAVSPPVAAGAWDDIAREMFYGAAGPSIFFKSLSGTLSAFGSLRKKMTAPVFSGSITMTSTVSSRIVIQRLVTGSITATGSILRLVQKRVLGGVSMAGVLRRRIAVRRAGVIATTGALNRRIRTMLTGSLQASGAFFDRFTLRRTYGASITPSGTASGVTQGPPPAPASTTESLNFLRRFIGRR
jgi:hypothetical protein